MNNVSLKGANETNRYYFHLKPIFSAVLWLLSSNVVSFDSFSLKPGELLQTGNDQVTKFEMESQPRIWAWNGDLAMWGNPTSDLTKEKAQIANLPLPYKSCHIMQLPNNFLTLATLLVSTCRVVQLTK